MWIDAHAGTYLTLSGANIDAAIDRSGSGNSPTETLTRRPTYDATAFGGRGGMLFTAANSSRLTTPTFAMGARSSGSAVWRPTGANQGLLEFHNINTHTLVFYAAGNLTVRRVSGGGGDAVLAATAPLDVRCTWAFDGSRLRAIINGNETIISFGGTAPPALSSELTIGGISRGAVWPLNGHVGEIVFADAVWTDAQMDAVDAAMAARWGF